jgi:hypothetical protein
MTIVKLICFNRNMIVEEFDKTYLEGEGEGDSSKP